uniref:Uncharacterized protein n=1 Tax=Pararge aegeria TaxID=116150 RepID=S4NVX7_9NEOP
MFLNYVARYESKEAPVLNLRHSKVRRPLSSTYAIHCNCKVLRVVQITIYTAWLPLLELVSVLQEYLI